jgi:hypothetical protein
MQLRIRTKDQSAGFSLTEVVISIAITATTFAGIIYGYLGTGMRAEWSAYSLAAQSFAMEGVEQARAAKWDPQAWPPIDQLGITNYTQVDQLDVPVSGAPILATNYISITTISTTPPVRELRADCVWMLTCRPPSACGPFTNTVITYRAVDQ